MVVKQVLTRVLQTSRGVRAANIALIYELKSNRRQGAFIAGFLGQTSLSSATARHRAHCTSEGGRGRIERERRLDCNSTVEADLCARIVNKSKGGGSLAPLAFYRNRTLNQTRRIAIASAWRLRFLCSSAMLKLPTYVCWHRRRVPRGSSYCFDPSERSLRLVAPRSGPHRAWRTAGFVNSGRLPWAVRQLGARVDVSTPPDDTDYPARFPKAQAASCSSGDTS